MRVLLWILIFGIAGQECGLTIKSATAQLVENGRSYSVWEGVKRTPLEEKYWVPYEGSIDYMLKYDVYIVHFHCSYTSSIHLYFDKAKEDYSFADIVTEVETHPVTVANPQSLRHAQRTCEKYVYEKRTAFHNYRDSTPPMDIHYSITNFSPVQSKLYKMTLKASRADERIYYACLYEEPNRLLMTNLSTENFNCLDQAKTKNNWNSLMREKL